MHTTKIPVRKEIEKVTAYVPGKPIEEVQREFGLERIIKLASNENPSGCSPLAKEAIVSEIEKIALYPESLAPALAEKLAKRLNTAPARFIFGNGSEELIAVLTRSYINAGDEAIMGDITFPLYKINVLIEGGNPIVVPLTEGVHDLEAMFKAITPKTRMIFICNPNNPTGTIVDKDELLSFIERVPQNILIILDEAYYEYAQGERYLETVPLLDKHANLVILRTFSKAYGLAGTRIGYGIVEPAIQEQLIKVKSVFNSNRLAQAAAMASLDDIAFMEECVRKNATGRAYLEKELLAMGFSCYPSHTNFLMIKLNRSGEEVFNGLLKQGIIVRPITPETIRVTIGTEEENQEFITALRKVIT